MEGILKKICNKYNLSKCNYKKIIIDGKDYFYVDIIQKNKKGDLNKYCITRASIEISETDLEDLILTGLNYKGYADKKIKNENN